ncbi:MAG: type II secretion system F family protein, partial [Planctomycetota bacterium]
MKTFEYTAVDAKGTRREGRMWSSDEAELDRQLEREGLTLMKAGEVRTARARKRFRIKSRDLLAFTAQLGTVTAAGVPLVEGLQGIGKRASSSDVGGLMDDMVSDLEAGESLSKAMERHPRAFPG